MPRAVCLTPLLYSLHLFHIQLKCCASVQMNLLAFLSIHSIFIIHQFYFTRSLFNFHPFVVLFSTKLWYFKTFSIKFQYFWSFSSKCHYFRSVSSKFQQFRNKYAHSASTIQKLFCGFTSENIQCIHFLPLCLYIFKAKLAPYPSGHSGHARRRMCLLSLEMWQGGHFPSAPILTPVF